jgi:HEAT repeat protein
VAALAPLCADFDWRTMREEAVRTLGKLGDAQAIPILVGILAREDYRDYLDFDSHRDYNKWSEAIRMPGLQIEAIKALGR